MPTFNGFDAFNRELAALGADYDSARVAAILKPAAEVAGKAAESVVPGDLGGDMKFSGWAPSLFVEDRLVKGGRLAIVHPTRTSAGPWTVAEQGRNKGNASGFQGPGVNRRTGMTSKSARGGKVRRFRQKRWNGYTRGFGTGSKAVAAIEKATEPIIEQANLKFQRRRFDVT